MDEPKVSREQIEKLLSELHYETTVVPGTTTTIATAINPDGFTLAIGKSACVCPENFDAEQGKFWAIDAAKKQAEDKLWELEGYALYKKLHPHVESIAKKCHELNRAYCEALGDRSQVPWDDAPEWQKQSAVNGVIFHMENPTAGASASHDSWLKEKAEAGWRFGDVKDAEAKTHPCFRPYNELPVEQRVKDTLFKTVIDLELRRI